MIFDPSPVTIKNYKTDQDFILKPLKSYESNQDRLLEDIFNCCSEELIYETLFKGRHPEGYTKENAADFLSYSENGWKDQTHFIFGIFKPTNQELVGAIDIKSPNKSKSEVGYWLSKKYSGLMTNALLAIVDIAKDAGYKSLEIYTEASNQKSEGVVKRANFNYQETKTEEGETRKYHLLDLI